MDAVNITFSTTSLPAANGLTTETMYILIGALGGSIVLLSLVLLVIFCTRKSRRTEFNSTIIAQEVFNSTTVAQEGHDNTSFENLERDDDSIYRPNPDIQVNDNRDTAYMNIDSRGSTANENNLQDEATTSRNTVPPKTSVSSQNSDYENASDMYENERFEDKSPDSLLPPGEQPKLAPRAKRCEEKNISLRIGTKAYHLYSNALHDYELPRNSLSLHKVIGKGHFSAVYSGIAANLPYSSDGNKMVAIKTMKNSASDSDKHEFLREFEIMKLTNSLNHDNITKLLGSVTKSHPCMMVLELMPNGNLRSFLRATRSQDVYYNLHGNSSCLSERQLLQFALDIANGMEGIADLQLLHRDLAARNILLDANLTCKISDFGFAKDILNKPVYKSKSVLHRARPIRWLAPESVLLFKHSILSDVWSYGIVLWEIVTLGNLPYPQLKMREVRSVGNGYC